GSAQCLHRRSLRCDAPAPGALVARVAGGRSIMTEEPGTATASDATAADDAAPAACKTRPASSGLRGPRWVDKALLRAGLALFGYVISRYPLRQIESAVAGMWPGVALTPLIALSWFAAGTSSLYLLLDRRIRWLRLLWIRLVGDSYNALLPLAGFGGE